MRKLMQGADGNGTGSQRADGPAGNAGRNPDERERRRKEMLDSTTPEERAQVDQFRKDMQARRAQRGMGPVFGGPGGPRP
jgi:hypothetical protein